MKIITLCGSTKFKKEFEDWNKNLTLQKNIVLSVVLFSHEDNHKLSIEEKNIFFEMHKKKIDISDEIFVIDVDGYIGESTKKEIEYAKSKGKKVIYLSQIS